MTSFLSRYRLVPDFFVQMAIQLTYYRLMGKCVATYETAHTRLYVERKCGPPCTMCW